MPQLRPAGPLRPRVQTTQTVSLIFISQRESVDAREADPMSDGTRGAPTIGETIGTAGPDAGPDRHGEDATADLGRGRARPPADTANEATVTSAEATTAETAGATWTGATTAKVATIATATTEAADAATARRRRGAPREIAAGPRRSRRSATAAPAPTSNLKSTCRRRTKRLAAKTPNRTTGW